MTSISNTGENAGQGQKVLSTDDKSNSQVASNQTKKSTQSPKPEQGKKQKKENKDKQLPTMLTGKIVTPIPPSDFPDTKLDARKNPAPLSTIPNLQFLLQYYGIEVKYDVIAKKFIIIVPGQEGCPDNADAAAWAMVVSLVKLNNMATGHLADYLVAVANINQYNPVADWILSKPWDGRDRLSELCETLSVRADFPLPLRNILVRRWLISAVAAAIMPGGFGSRGVLVLQGAQSLGKTRWIMKLVPDRTLQEQVVKIDHHLDASDKDSKLTAVRHWMVEIGELDSSFRKDVARLKGFITGTKDKIRVPYAKADSEFSRRTVFCATVNESAFLVDDTGNTRWWTIPLTAINYDHGIDMQQVFAQVYDIFNTGEQWWLTQEEEVLLEDCNKDHRTTSVIREMIEANVDFTRKTGWKKASLFTATEILNALGIQTPTNPQAKECNAVLRGHLGEPSRSNGKRGWRIEFIVTPDNSSSF